MNGTLIYDIRIAPKKGDTIIIWVKGENFPSGAWSGYLWDFDSQNFELLNDGYTAKCPCFAKIGEGEWQCKEPSGPYTVFPGSPGTKNLLIQLNDQKAEVKALKKQLEENEQTARDVFKGLYKLAGIHKLDVMASHLHAIYAPSVKK